MGVILEKQGLQVREFATRDAAAAASWMTPSPLDLFMVSSSFEYPLTAEKFLEYASRAKIPEHRLYSVFTANDGVHVGHFEIKNISTKHKNGTGAHIIVSPACRGKGVGRGLMGCLGDIAFEALGLERLSLSVHTVNVAATALYVKSGYQFEGTIRDVLLFEGKRYSLYQLSILRGEYRSGR